MHHRYEGGVSGILKTGDGLLILGGINTFTGNTTIDGGTLQLADNAQLKFVVSDATSNTVTGGGTATFNGDFTIDTAAVTGTAGGIWTLVDLASLNPTSSFSATFSVVGFSDPEVDGIWTMTDAKGDWSFSEATGELTLDVGNDYDSWKTTNGVAGGENDDDDNDGLTNHEEYAFGLDPTGGSSVNPITVPLSKTSGTFSLHPPRPKSAGSVPHLFHLVFHRPRHLARRHRCRWRRHHSQWRSRNCPCHHLLQSPHQSQTLHPSPRQLSPQTFNHYEIPPPHSPSSSPPSRPASSPMPSRPPTLGTAQTTSRGSTAAARIGRPHGTTTATRMQSSTPVIHGSTAMLTRFPSPSVTERAPTPPSDQPLTMRSGGSRPSRLTLTALLPAPETPAVT